MVRVELAVPPRSPYVGVVRLALASLARAAALDEETVEDLKIAVSEACANAVLAGEESGAEDQIQVTWTEDLDRITVDVDDRATLLESEDAEATPGSWDRRAMSAALLETLVDRCEVQQLEGGGVRTRLVVARPQLS